MTVEEIKNLTQWALDRGATQVSIGEVRFHFLEALATEPDVPPNMRQYLGKGSDSVDSDPAPSNPEGVRRSQDPDEYAHVSDQWANWRPMPNRE